MTREGARIDRQGSLFYAVFKMPELQGARAACVRRHTRDHEIALSCLWTMLGDENAGSGDAVVAGIVSIQSRVTTLVMASGLFLQTVHPGLDVASPLTVSPYGRFPVSS